MEPNNPCSPIYQGRLTPLCLFIAAAFPCTSLWADGNLSPTLPVQEVAQNVDFDSSFLNLENTHSVDLSRFANGASATPGRYRVSIYVNNDPVGNEEVEFTSHADGSVYPCLTPQILQ